MAIPNKATGYGNLNNRNVFRILFSEALSAAPVYKAWDPSGAFPGNGAAATTNNTIFAGTAGNGNKPMLCLVDTSNVAPGVGWKPASATAGSANPNRLKGNTNYVTSPKTPLAGEAITFNMVCEVPSDATTSSTMGHVLQCVYQYAGAAPTVTWGFNEGTEAAPTWTAWTPGTHGIRHAKAGASAPNYYATIPQAGTQDTEEGWVTT